MFHRIANPLISQSFFLFGARGTGKSTFLKQQFPLGGDAYVIDLLDSEQEDLYARNPKHLANKLASMKVPPEWVFIDEVQRIPRLLDLVHKLIEEKNQKFILSGSSARKLKRGGANLLAGRAFVNYLFPMTEQELGEAFDLDFVLRWGSLPKIFSFKDDQERKAYLRAYALTYIKEEIQMEQIVRQLDPFRSFLDVAAQINGRIINCSNIANDVGVDSKTVSNYYQILEETWIGFYLPHFHLSVRKSQKIHPKFYFFDLGVCSTLAGSIDSKPTPSTSSYGQLFEQFFICEIFRLNQYTQKDYRLSFYATKNGAEIDLILSKGRKHILVKIKSSSKIDEGEVNKLARIAAEFPTPNEIFYVSQFPEEIKIDQVICCHWRSFLNKMF
ncbi:MAG: ATP-binding protein [Oligoflexia bacterium]|nr:ATP-binding protein [Oligoflexia bacterium]